MSSYTIYDFSKELLKDTLKISNSEYFFEYFEGYRKEKIQSDKKYENWKIIVVVEEDYVDKFYLKDYSEYYVEGFCKENKYATRIHFFLSEHNKNEFEENLLHILSTGIKDDIDQLNEKYLGHIVKKPIKDLDEKYFLIGRTNLKPYMKIIPEKSNTYRRFITCKNEFSLFGVDLNVETLPFHQQDVAVGACASAALWMTQFAINNFHSIPIRSLAEITGKGKFWYALPTYPNEGLKIDEICKYITEIGLPFHIIEVEEMYKMYSKIYDEQSASDYIDKLIEDAINAYIPGKFPLISVLHLEKIRKSSIFRKDVIEDGHHAVVITGYREENGRLAELYLHDDQIGPYCRTKIDYPMIFLENDWKKKYDRIIMSVLLIPIDPMIKMSFTRIFQFYLDKIKDELIKNKYLDYWFFLKHISSYKQKLLKENVKESIFYRYEDGNIIEENPSKELLLQKNFPKYVWVIRFFGSNNKVEKDIILDSTTIFWRPIARISYA
jgi:hypothetical protein